MLKTHFKVYYLRKIGAGEAIFLEIYSQTLQVRFWVAFRCFGYFSLKGASLVFGI